jgi:hypothetical protein
MTRPLSSDRQPRAGRDFTFASPAGTCIATRTVGDGSSPATLSTNSRTLLAGSLAGVISA